MGKIKVLVVDDSGLTRKVLSKMISEDSEIEVVGVAPDAFDAEEKIRNLKPDVITLDIEMPGMDGLAFLENMRKIYTIPVIVVSTWGDRGSEVEKKAVSLGAYDVIKKPSNSEELPLMGKQLVIKLKSAVRETTPNHGK